METDPTLEAKIQALLVRACGTPQALRPGVDLLESGLLDSLALITLLELLEDELGVELQPTRLDRNCLRTPKGIAALVRAARSPDQTL